VAARGLSRELATGTYAGCFALITEQHAPNRIAAEEPDRQRSPAMSAGPHD
jgi:hypothetical protein